MVRFGDRQRLFLNEIQQTLTESQKLYHNDMYFRKLERRGTTIDSFRHKEYVLLSDFSAVFHAVDSALLSKTPKAHYSVGPGSTIMMALATHCPYWLLDLLLTATNYTNPEPKLEGTRL